MFMSELCCYALFELNNTVWVPAFTLLWASLVPPVRCLTLQWLALSKLQVGDMRGFLAVQSVPIAIYEGLFGSAKCPHRHI